MTVGVCASLSCSLAYTHLIDNVLQQLKDRHRQRSVTGADVVLTRASYRQHRLCTACRQQPLTINGISDTTLSHEYCHQTPAAEVTTHPSQASISFSTAFNGQ